MPLVTLTTTRATSRETIDHLLDAIHAALIGIGVPPADRFHRVLHLESEDLRADRTYPDLKRPRSERFVLIELTLSVGRTLKQKKQVAGAVVAAAEKVGISGEGVMLVFNETRWENWSFGGGRFFYA